MKKVMMIVLVSMVTLAYAGESIGNKNCAATQASQKREMGKKIVTQPHPIPQLEEKKATAVTQE